MTLSIDEVEDLLAGEGMGFALSAELNGYPGPRHVLELGDDLELSETQTRDVEAIMAVMRSETRRLGEQIVELERDLDTDTSLVRRSDLTPLRYGAVVGGEVHRVTFHGGRIEGTIEPVDSSARNFSYDLESAPFNAVMDVDVIRALPVADGFEATLASYDPPRPPPPAPTRVRVRGMEILATAGGDVPAWNVAYDAGGPPTTLWFAVEDRRFLRLRTELPDGATFWKLHRRDMEAWRASR